MALLADGEIKRAIADGEIGIEPFEDACLQPASYDLRVGSRAIITKSLTLGELEELKKEVESLEPLTPDVALRHCRQHLFIGELENVFEFKVQSFGGEVCKSLVELKEGIIKARHQCSVERIGVMQADQVCRQIPENTESA